MSSLNADTLSHHWRGLFALAWAMLMIGWAPRMHQEIPLCPFCHQGRSGQRTPTVMPTPNGWRVECECGAFGPDALDPIGAIVSWAETRMWQGEDYS